MNYCSHCGSQVQVRVPEGDDRPRHVCTGCHAIHYQNPKLVVGCIPEWQDSILLCRRSIEPRSGLWTVPAGFMENGETTHQGAVREALEEARAEVRITELFSVFNLPHIDQVYMLYRGSLQEPSFGPGAESLEVRLFAEGEIPWDEIAFPVIRETLMLYFDDRRNDGFRLHMGDIVRVSEQPRRYRVRLF